jgi:hypothetical protein
MARTIDRDRLPQHEMPDMEPPFTVTIGFHVPLEYNNVATAEQAASMGFKQLIGVHGSGHQDAYWVTVTDHRLQRREYLRCYEVDRSTSPFSFHVIDPTPTVHP